jgi:hypothetical protein
MLVSWWVLFVEEEEAGPRCGAALQAGAGVILTDCRLAYKPIGCLARPLHAIFPGSS